LDRLAQRGTLFTRAFACTPVCSPSRATFFTGKLPSHHGVQDFLMAEDSYGPDSIPFLQGHTSFADALKANGYFCGMVGKWHLGHDTEATALSKATDVGVAAKHLSQLASACAECHALTDGGPGLDGMRGVPPQQWSEGDNMPLHLWAVDWMWLGLVAPNDEAWDRGVAELDSKPLAAMFGENEPTAQKLEKQVYALAKKAGELGPAKHTERAAIMGELLATCATCHVLRDQKSDDKK